MARMREETLRGRELKDEGQVEDTQERDLENPPGEDTLDSNDMSSLEKIMTLEAELTQAKAKADEHYNHVLRLQAEFDNYRKRTQKEKTEIIKHSTERLVAELLPVLDNFERAASSAQSNPDFNAFSQGVDMIYRQLQTALGKEGLKPIEAVGQPFDPNLHDAVLRVESDDHSENTVVEELQKGYYLKEKVLRPSMVKVSN
ncbi:nucleotide exchange factor GrpE [Desulfosporosinus sp.]|uniref:nucleotide exchange factor GrpE n=1 Tax=Desulfosporosinus sp. TaxID=157907 RepID=UPI000E812A52|nr:nucleotide exchange factor GrpE [Desulfosporosinus sp.]MBC2721068.1 nucleotide exchange factor GrpE [Desulfosporosinus sp.]MBC2725610.1 nucleotide exchange factor GrpE [Desulfosporosinus sp.]HBV88131.1 nucleotide exchange factor GrpE [Desulfosporosinus sp.]